MEGKGRYEYIIIAYSFRLEIKFDEFWALSGNVDVNISKGLIAEENQRDTSMKHILHTYRLSDLTALLDS